MPNPASSRSVRFPSKGVRSNPPPSNFSGGRAKGDTDVDEDEADEVASDSAPRFNLHVEGTRPTNMRRHVFDLPANPYSNPHVPEEEVVPEDIEQRNLQYVLPCLCLRTLFFVLTLIIT